MCFNVPWKEVRVVWLFERHFDPQPLLNIGTTGTAQSFSEGDEPVCFCSDHVEGSSSGFSFQPSLDILRLETSHLFGTKSLHATRFRVTWGGVLGREFIWMLMRMLRVRRWNCWWMRGSSAVGDLAVHFYTVISDYYANLCKLYLNNGPNIYIYIYISNLLYFTCLRLVLC